jgi:outer membrane assembly lipoprotein YfiO
MVLFASPAALGQRVLEMTDEGWTTTPPPESGTDRATISEARRLLAEGKPKDAQRILDAWIALNENNRTALLPEAYLLRGDCKLAMSDEFEALYDYERVVKDFSGSEFFTRALEREFEVAKLYLGGLRKRTFGVRIDSGKPTAEEIIMRINERLPGSRLAETALLTLADYYYAQRDLRMAAETYDVFLTLFPKSEHRRKAMQRRAYSNIARFKGPKYDASGLVEARFQIERFQREFPAQAEQAGMSDALIARIDESAAAQRLSVARWYLKRNDPVSARLTLQRLIRAYPTTVAAEEAIDICRENDWPLEAVPRNQRGTPQEPAAPAATEESGATPAATEGEGR